MGIRKLIRVYQLKGDTLFKKIIGSKYFLRKPFAIAIYFKILQKYSPRIKYIQVYEIEDRVYYTITKEELYEKGFLIDRGHGLQIAIQIQCWRRTKDDILEGGDIDAEVCIND